MMHDRHDRLINRQVLYFKPSYWWNAVKNVKESCHILLILSIEPNTELQI